MIIYRGAGTGTIMSIIKKKRLIRRARAASDRRAVVVQLTARGNKILRDVTLPHLEELQTAGRKLLQALATVMKHANSNYEARS